MGRRPEPFTGKEPLSAGLTSRSALQYEGLLLAVYPVHVGNIGAMSSLLVLEGQQQGQLRSGFAYQRRHVLIGRRLRDHPSSDLYNFKNVWCQSPTELATADGQTCLRRLAISKLRSLEFRQPCIMNHEIVRVGKRKTRSLTGAHLITGSMEVLAEDVEAANHNTRFTHALMDTILIREPQAPTRYLATVLGVDGAPKT